MAGGLLLFSLPACGSDALRDVLSAHPDLRCFREPFNPEVPDPTGRRTASPTLAQVDAVLDGVWTDSPAIEHVWDPSGWPFPKHSPHNGHVLLRGTRVLLLSRRNLLRLAVEHAAASQQRPGPDSAAEIGNGIGEGRGLDIARIRWHLNQIPPSLRTHRRALYVRNRPVLDLMFEDLFGPALETDVRRSALERIYTFFGCGIEDDTVDQARIDDWLAADPPGIPDERLRDLPDIEDVEQQLGSDETGWLFPRSQE